jgi:hypothetical protein
MNGISMDFNIFHGISMSLNLIKSIKSHGKSLLFLVKSTRFPSNPSGSTRPKGARLDGQSLPIGAAARFGQWPG